MAEQTKYLTDAELETLRWHTPGPWKLGQAPSWCAVSGVALRYVYRPGDDERSRIRLSGELCDVDAALVHAAPALLAEVIERRALDAAVAELIAAGEAFPDEPNPYTYRMALAKLRAALAAVRGGAK